MKNEVTLASHEAAKVAKLKATLTKEQKWKAWTAIRNER